MASDNDVRRALLILYGGCVCSPEYCADEDDDSGSCCQACAHLDPEWHCYADEVVATDGD